MDKRKKAKLLYWKYGVSYQQISEILDVKVKKVWGWSSIDGWKYDGRNLSSKTFFKEWDLKGEQSAIDYYEEIKNNYKYPLRIVAKAFGVRLFEIVRLLDSSGIKLNKYQKEWQKYMTHTKAQEGIKLYKKIKLTVRDVEIRINRCGLRDFLVKYDVRLNMKSPSEKELKKMEKLWSKGITPKQMNKEHGIDYSEGSIYYFLRKRGIDRGYSYRKQKDLRKILAKSKYEIERYRAWYRLARRLTDETYKEYWEEIDPYRSRNQDFHLDHKISVHRAYCLGWTPEEVAYKSNLQMLPAVENRMKSIN